MRCTLARKRCKSCWCCSAAFYSVSAARVSVALHDDTHAHVRAHRVGMDILAGPVELGLELPVAVAGRQPFALGRLTRMRHVPGVCMEPRPRTARQRHGSLRRRCTAGAYASCCWLSTK
jgi:hypothetical protein